MKITIKCFAGCKDVVGRAEQHIELTDNTTVGGAFDHLVGLYPDLARFKTSLMLAVNTDYADRDMVLKEGDVMACIPPVSGGLHYEWNLVSRASYV